MIRRALSIAALATALVASSFGPALAAGDPLVIEGAGFGHGIGMSQYGSYGRALDGQDYAEILASYYPGTSLATLGEDGLPSIDLIYTNVASDDESALITIESGPGSGGTPTTVTRGTDPLATIDMYPGDSVLVADLDGSAGAGGCVAVFDVAGGPVEWESGTCDFSFTLAASDTSPDNVVSVDACRTTNCRFAWGESFELVDNYSGQRTHPDYGYKGFDMVVISTMDDYILGIAESVFSWGNSAAGMHALRTQAVAARSYAATFAGPLNPASAGCFCDIRNHSSYQVYAGWLGPTNATAGRTLWEKWDQAARETAGEVAWKSGASGGSAWQGVIRAYYSSSNGGASENNEDIWNGSPIAWLRSVEDPWSVSESSGNPLRSWTEETTTSVLESKLDLDEVNDVTIAQRYESGTPSKIVVTGQRNGQTVIVDEYAGEWMDGVLFDSWFGLYGPHINSISGDLPEPPPLTDTARWFGDNRYQTAVQISKANFSSADAVVIATGLNYPDALAAASFAAIIDAPVLLVAGGTMPSSTLAEVQRLGPDDIFILGGPVAVPQVIEDTLDGIAPVTRLEGSNRYGTAIKISQAAHTGPVETVYVAPGTSFVEALVAGPIAASTNSAILLVPPTSLPGAVATELQRLDPDRIVVVGGGTVVSSSVVNQLGAYADTVESIAGANRYATSVAVSKHGYPSGADTVLIATGTIFPDALAGAGVAGDLDAPVLLVEPNNLPASVATELARLDPLTVRILGGPEAISGSVVEEIIDLLD